MNITIKIDSVCASGGHINMTATINNTIIKNIVFDTNDLFQLLNDIPDQEAILAIIKHNLKKAGYTKNTPAATIKTAIESEVYYI